MCSEAGLAVDSCSKSAGQQHAGPREAAPEAGRSPVEEVWKQTQRMMEESEHLVRIMTHVCSQRLSGVRSSVAQYSQGCWRRCSVNDAEDDRRGPQQQQQHATCCEGCMSPCRTQPQAGVQQQQQQRQKKQGEEEPCRCRGPGPRWRRRRGGCQCGQCEDCISMDTRGGTTLPPAQQCCCPAHTTTTTTTPKSPPTTSTITQATLPSTTSTSSTSTPARRWRSGLPSPPSILTVLLLLVAALARFTEGCSSRSTPKPRPPSPTMRPNITFQTFACPPAYADWYCLNGATCFTVKIEESILYNCECADGYMGQRCEFKDLDGSYLLHTREKVLLETASIAGGATVACVLVFVVLFAVYVFMQKDKDKRCRDLDNGCDNDHQPFSGYKRPRAEIIRTIINPYAQPHEDLSYVEVQPSKPTISPGVVKEAGSPHSVPGSDTCSPSSSPS
ncbi:uncharacterized protein LOC126993840 isoform X1 [Eriocheir sinensis]|uniref:uncharacterized protein LOC126993840 isoform X1 n=2 Tax=Eriocheir sinensis TaxID=95602 RepID=UPI0021C736E3|nr:uncharacterized protein LOC126993840 isoform X1 [Eriocheir sinensis]